ncbi:MAG TPA: rRNA adenine dimethylase [Nitrospirae bacterium]|nr:rRNA adenine dimethylase [Nitrospirota bacterium]
MEGLIKKFLNKIHNQGLSNRDDTIIIAFDDRAYSNADLIDKYTEVFDFLNINTLIVSTPSEPYKTVVQEIINDPDTNCLIKPVDCETRTFFHDIPIIEDDSPQSIISALSRRKSAVTKNGKIITYGTISPEQAYISLSSVCFSLFVKYLYDALEFKKIGESLSFILSFCNEIEITKGCLLHRARGIIDEITEAGKALINLRLVDSYFGNISCLFEDKIYISQTGSSLDELEDAIDIVPIDGSSTNAITASSEYAAHRLIYEKTDFKFILHGHPKFSVILSMLCNKKYCKGDDCYRTCKEERKIGNVQIVSGEIGTGKWGLLNTVPLAMTKSSVVAVYGHGIFSGSKLNFNEALKRTIEAENYCIREYKRLIDELK